MGLSLSLLSSATAALIGNKVFVLAEDVEAILAKSFSFGETDVNMALRSISFKNMDTETMLSPSRPGKIVFERSLSFRNWEPVNTKLETVDSSKTPNMEVDKTGSFELESTVDEAVPKLEPAKCFPQLVSPRSISELDAAAVKLQKVYKSYRTRRNLADCAVVVEELWWKALDFASLKQSSVSFFNVEKPETAVSRWSRARTRVAKVGKGLSKDDKAQKLALQHWLEAIDPRHRYGHNLHLYYDIWFINESSQPFFYWLDVGDGKEVNLEKCPRSSLQQQCIKYLGPKEREAYEVIVECGKLIYKQSETLVDTVEGSKWIFVLSTSRDLYVGQKKKGKFQHSSFLAGGATTAAGRLVAKDGVLKAIWPYSGHYHPTEENFEEFISFLKDNDVNLTDVKRCSVDDDEFPSFHKTDKEAVEITEGPATEATDISRTESEEPPTESPELEAHVENDMEKDDAPRFDIGKRLSCKWTTGTGPRIGCVRDYPTELQFKALEQVNLSPRVIPSPMGNKCPIPSPRPSPRVRLSPRLAYMGIPSPTVSLTLPKPKKW